MTFSGKWQDYSISNKVIFVLGKGGTGKTTTAAALGLAAAGAFKKVLVVSLDSAHSLGDVLKKDLGSKPVQVRQNLFALELDLEAAVQSYLKETMTQMKSLYNYLQVFNLESHLKLLQDSPGTEEYAVLRAITDILRNGAQYDLIIFDTAPTGVTLRVLALPAITLKWLRGLEKLRLNILDKRQAVENISGPKKVKVGREWVELAAREKEDAVLREIRRYGREIDGLREIFSNADVTQGIIVMNPDRLSALESKRALAKLAGYGFAVKTAVINRAYPAGLKKEPLGGEISKLKAEYAHLEWVLQPDHAGRDLFVEQLLGFGGALLQNKGLKAFFGLGGTDNE